MWLFDGNWANSKVYRIMDEYLYSYNFSVLVLLEKIWTILALECYGVCCVDSWHTIPWNCMDGQCDYKVITYEKHMHFNSVIWVKCFPLTIYLSLKIHMSTKFRMCQIYHHQENQKSFKTKHKNKLAQVGWCIQKYMSSYKTQSALQWKICWWVIVQGLFWRRSSLWTVTIP